MCQVLVHSSLAAWLHWDWILDRKQEPSCAQPQPWLKLFMCGLVAELCTPTHGPVAGVQMCSQNCTCLVHWSVGNFFPWSWAVVFKTLRTTALGFLRRGSHFLNTAPQTVVISTYWPCIRIRNEICIQRDLEITVPMLQKLCLNSSPKGINKLLLLLCLLIHLSPAEFDQKLKCFSWLGKKVRRINNIITL